MTKFLWFDRIKARNCRPKIAKPRQPIEPFKRAVITSKKTIVETKKIVNPKKPKMKK